MIEIPLKCQCGSVQGTIRLTSHREGNHVVCFCDDCQSFANQLSSDQNILDQWGGTRVYQVAPWRVHIHKGMDQLRCLRLTRKGLYRWYTECCRTPVGNTISAKLPFIGLIHNFMDTGKRKDSLLGPVMGYHKLASANGDVPESIRKKGMPATSLARVFWRLFKWKLTGRNRPNPFFGKDGKSISKPTIVNP